MNFPAYLAASAFALASVSRPALAQHMNMPGMTMPMKAKPTPKKAASKKVAPKKRKAKEAAKKRGTIARKAEQNPMTAMSMPMTPDSSEAGASVEQHGPMSMPMPMPGQPAPAAGMSKPVGQAPVDHSHMSGMAMGHRDHGTAMTGALGRYPMQREASGTSWQPDESEHMGLMSTAGDWMLMGHGVLNLVYDHQSGRRGDDKAFASGMLMGMARRPLGNGTIQFKAMISPDPLMGASGYPLLLASGETANGRDRLIDRQHPHDFFIELSGTVSQNIGTNSSVFLYAGLPGEPAFGPPAFQHREAIADSPEAPISHHWLDSTHVSLGVVTAGIILDRAKIEASRFNGREPDQHRWNIETGPLDSTAVRVSWNPTPELALQGSWGNFVDPEQLEPGVDQKRLSASALYARGVAPGWKLAGTLAWGRKTVDHHSNDAFVAEGSVEHAKWTVFGRGEMTENRELLEGVEHGRADRVGKVSLGALRDFRVADHVTFGVGGLFSLNFVPRDLETLYGGKSPTGAMAFVRLKFD